MDYVQERVTTLHDLTGHAPAASPGRAAVVVPMTEHEYAGLAAERILTELERVDPGRVIVALRAPPARIDAFREWLAGFDLQLELLWCNAPPVGGLLAERGLDGDRAGKGRDVWLALGVAAAAHDYVVLHDADAKTYSAADVARLLHPLEQGYDFSKGYYARVEGDGLYGRLFRLFYAPLVRTLADRHDEDVLEYLDSFRYALAGEFAMTADLATEVRVQRQWGLEVGTLGEAFERVGFEGSAQVDLGTHQHDHRPVGGPTGLSDMSEHVGTALFRVLEAQGVEPEYETLPERFRETASRFVRQYAADATFNGLAHDPDDDRAQVETYADAIVEPGADERLPAWSTLSLKPEDVLAASRTAVDEVVSAKTAHDTKP